MSYFQISFYKKKKKNLRDFPGDPVLKKPPANAGDTASVPGGSLMPQGNLAHTLEPMLWSYWAHVLQLLRFLSPRAQAPQQKKSPQWEAPAPQLNTGPHLPQLEKDQVQQQKLSAVKNK